MINLKQKLLIIKIRFIKCYKIIFIVFIFLIFLFSITHKKDIYNEYKSYINICINGTLIDETKYNKSSNPKITVIMPVYNFGTKLYYSIRSIQNQRMKEIEMILINDASGKDTLNIIERMKIEDPRIKIINNGKNRRILYSKSIGALYANGKYILELDQDDMFISDKVFDILYTEAEKNKLDLLKFNNIELHNFRSDENMNDKGINYEEKITIEFQPNIKNLMFKKYLFRLWGMLIKTDIYKKAVIILWPIVINYKIVHYEDYSITFLIIILSKKFEYINHFYLAHLKHDQSASQKIKNYHISILLFFNFMFEYNVKNNEENKIIFLNYIYNYKSIFYELRKNFPKLFDFVFKKIFPFFEYEDQKQILNIIQINESKIKMWNSYRYFMNESEFKSIKSFQNSSNKKSRTKVIYSLSPTFSIIIYCKNKAFIEKTLYSIENQNNFTDYEIILIYDNNDEKILEYLYKLMNHFSNVKLLNNKKKRGVFFSYYKGILKAKGKYILTIKSGYTLSKDNILFELNKYINNEKDIIDILEFNLLISNKEYIADSSLTLYKCCHFKSEFNLDNLKFNLIYKQIDQEKELIVNKIIKSNIYKNLIGEYKFLFINNYINNYYDDIIMFLISQKKVKIKHLDIFGIMEYSQKLNVFDTSKINDCIYYINFLYDHSEDSVKGKKFPLNEFYNNMNHIYNKFNNITTRGMNLLFKFLKCNYISTFEKKNIIIYFNALIDRNKYKIIEESYKEKIFN